MWLCLTELRLQEDASGSISDQGLLRCDKTRCQQCQTSNPSLTENHFSAHYCVGWICMNAASLAHKMLHATSKSPLNPLMFAFTRPALESHLFYCERHQKQCFMHLRVKACQRHHLVTVHKTPKHRGPAVMTEPLQQDGKIVWPDLILSRWRDNQKD